MEISKVPLVGKEEGYPEVNAVVTVEGNILLLELTGGLKETSINWELLRGCDVEELNVSVPLNVGEGRRFVQVCIDNNKSGNAGYKAKSVVVLFVIHKDGSIGIISVQDWYNIKGSCRWAYDSKNDGVYML